MSCTTSQSCPGPGPAQPDLNPQNFGNLGPHPTQPAIRRVPDNSAGQLLFILVMFKIYKNHRKFKCSFWRICGY